jgi:hypothetical protein
LNSNYNNNPTIPEGVNKIIDINQGVKESKDIHPIVSDISNLQMNNLLNNKTQTIPKKGNNKEMKTPNIDSNINLQSHDEEYHNIPSNTNIKLNQSNNLLKALNSLDSHVIHDPNQNINFKIHDGELVTNKLSKNLDNLIKKDLIEYNKTNSNQVNYFERNKKEAENNILSFLKSISIPKLDEVNKKLNKINSLSDSEKFESNIFLIYSNKKFKKNIE